MNRISFATVCMNRLHHLRITLPQNINDNLDAGNVEFVVLDYNSSDGLEEWMRNDMSEYIEKGILVYYKNPVPEFFNRSHSRNMMFKLATGEIICNIDADNYTGKGFAKYLRKQFDTHENIFINIDMSGRLYEAKGAFGRFAAFKKDFIDIGGYDENMVCYGFEDYDLANRFKLSGRREWIIDDVSFLNYIPHGNEERFKNEYTFNFLDSLFIHYINPALTDFLFLFKDGTYDRGILADSFNVNATSYRNLLDLWPERFQFNLKEGSWEKGRWEEKQDAYHLKYDDHRSTVLKAIDPDKSTLMNDEEAVFYKITHKKMVEEAVFSHSQVSNRAKMDSNTSHKKARVNPDGFGKGVVYKNLDYTTAIHLN